MLRVLLLCLAFHGISFAKPYDPEEPKEYHILSLSAAIIDHYFFISDEQLKSVTNEKGSWAPIDFETLTSILDKNLNSSKMIPGGSGANVIKGLAQLGEKCAIVGKVGSDDKGDYYFKKLKGWGIVPIFEKGTLPTGQAICLITPDGERTFRTYLGASHSLTDLHIDKSLFNEKVRLFHIEGYQLVDPDLTLRTLKLAKEFGITISLDLANEQIVRRNKEFILEVLEKYVDILFCNEKEAKVLTGLKASQACEELSKYCDVAIVTMSERGSWAKRGIEKVYMKALSVKAIDTTGAGDLYASGFLHGYLNGWSLKESAWLGAYVASEVVKRVGAEIPDSIWEEILKRIAKKGLDRQLSTTRGVDEGPAR